jgi:hypothetical protein
MALSFDTEAYMKKRTTVGLIQQQAEIFVKYTIEVIVTHVHRPPTAIDSLKWARGLEPALTRPQAEALAETMSDIITTKFA